MKQYNGYEPLDWSKIGCENPSGEIRGGVLSVILFVLSICSIWVSFWFALFIGEVDIFTMRGMIRYSWVIYFFIAIPLASLGFGIYQKKIGKVYRKNFVIAFICIPILVIFGSFKFIFPSDDYRSENVANVEYECGIDLPSNIEALTYYDSNYTMIYAKVLDKNEKVAFEQLIKDDPVWVESLSGVLEATIPDFVNYEFVECDWFVYYNKTNGEYNSFIAEGEYKFSLIGYDIELGRIVILHDCKFVAD